MELYLLVHPASDLNQYPTYDFKEMSGIWKESIQKASERGAFGIIYLSGTAYCYSDSHGERYHGYVSKHQHEIFEFFSGSFQERTKLVIAKNLYYPGIHHDPRITDITKVTARGIWADLCVDSSLDGICEAYGLSRDVCSIDFQESVFKGTDYDIEDAHKTLEKLKITIPEYRQCRFGERMEYVSDPDNYKTIRLDFRLDTHR